MNSEARIDAAFRLAALSSLRASRLIEIKLDGTAISSAALVEPHAGMYSPERWKERFP